MPQRQRRRGAAGRRRGRRRHIRRFLEPCLLLLLHTGKSHGYELAQALAPFGLGDVNPSLVYRMLREMETARLVRSEWDATAVAGPVRRIYHLTPEGARHLSAWVSDLGDTDHFLHYFLSTYQKHMSEGQGEYH